MKIANTIAKMPGSLQKPVLLMFISMIMLLAGPIKSFAGPDRQTITLNADNKSITQVLSEIEKQADYRFLFNSRLKDLKQRVTVTFNNAAITDVLQ
jgi:type II secretory pathway component GspD/PulD (secretin)